MNAGTSDGLPLSLSVHGSTRGLYVLNLEVALVHCGEKNDSLVCAAYADGRQQLITSLGSSQYLCIMQFSRSSHYCCEGCHSL